MTYTPVYKKYGDRGTVKLYQEKSERQVHNVEHNIRQLSHDKGSVFNQTFARFLWTLFHQGLHPALGLPHPISAGGNGGAYVLSGARLCDPMGSSVHGIFQARILEWVAISFSRGSSQYRDRIRISWVSWFCGWVLYQSSHTTLWSPLISDQVPPLLPMIRSKLSTYL